jgi:hypothetical protein
MHSPVMNIILQNIDDNYDVLIIILWMHSSIVVVRETFPIVQVTIFSDVYFPRFVVLAL